MSFTGAQRPDVPSRKSNHQPTPHPWSEPPTEHSHHLHFKITSEEDRENAKYSCLSHSRSSWHLLCNLSTTKQDKKCYKDSHRKLAELIHLHSQSWSHKAQDVGVFAGDTIKPVCCETGASGKPVSCKQKEEHISCSNDGLLPTHQWDSSSNPSNVE